MFRSNKIAISMFARIPKLQKISQKCAYNSIQSASGIIHFWFYRFSFFLVNLNFNWHKSDGTKREQQLCRIRLQHSEPNPDLCRVLAGIFPSPHSAHSNRRLPDPKRFETLLSDKRTLWLDADFAGELATLCPAFASLRSVCTRSNSHSSHSNRFKFTLKGNWY